MHKIFIPLALTIVSALSVAQTTKKDTYPFFQKSESGFGEKSPFDAWKTSSPKGFNAYPNGKSAQVSEWESRLFMVREEIKILKIVHDSNQDLAMKTKTSIAPMDDTFRTLNLRRAEERQLLKNLGLLGEEKSPNAQPSHAPGINAAWQR
jgi:hypothetical protein